MSLYSAYYCLKHSSRLVSEQNKTKYPLVKLRRSILSEIISAMKTIDKAVESKLILGFVSMLFLLLRNSSTCLLWIRDLSIQSSALSKMSVFHSLLLNPRIEALNQAWGVASLVMVQCLWEMRRSPSARLQHHSLGFVPATLLSWQRGGLVKFQWVVVWPGTGGHSTI